MMEDWNTGKRSKNRKIVMLEYWNIGKLGKDDHRMPPIIPSFHISIIPYFLK